MTKCGTAERCIACPINPETMNTCESDKFLADMGSIATKAAEDPYLTPDTMASRIPARFYASFEPRATVLYIAAMNIRKGVCSSLGGEV